MGTPKQYLTERQVSYSSVAQCYPSCCLTETSLRNNIKWFVTLTGFHSALNTVVRNWLWINLDDLDVNPRNDWDVNNFMREFWPHQNIPEWCDSMCSCLTLYLNALISPLDALHASLHPFSASGSAVKLQPLHPSTIWNWELAFPTESYREVMLRTEEDLAKQLCIH